jgi:hypothetical protein
MQMILLGTPITAAEASAAGLLAGIFTPGSVLERVVQIATKLAGMSPTALSLAKEAVCRCEKYPSLPHPFCDIITFLYRSSMAMCILQSARAELDLRGFCSVGARPSTLAPTTHVVCYFGGRTSVGGVSQLAGHRATETPGQCQDVWVVA